MNYVKRLGLASCAAFIVLAAYTLVLKHPSELNLDALLAVVLGGGACSLLAGVVSAAIVRKNLVVLVIFSQVISILVVGFVWAL